ncbi:MAG: alpha/beta hydrolase [Pirellulaceae bacterium]|nr:alpha/beta hydrolase [Pirellulaceae bacterium]
MQPSSPRSRVGHYLWRWTRLFAVGYLLVLLVLLLFENYLLYPAPRYPAGDWEAPNLPHEEVHFVSADGTKLHGWYFEHPQPRAVVLYCHGNGDHVAYLGPHLAELRRTLGVSIFAFDYRGYGRSEGAPAEAGILEDAAAARDWLARRAGVRPADLVLIGRSLGGGVVVDLAAAAGARGLVLQNTFTSLPDVAANIYPWLPVRLMMKNRYDSLAKIGRYQGPLFQSHGTRDELVPLALGQKLFAAAPGPKRFFEHDGGHNSAEPPEYYGELARFLDELPANSVSPPAMIATPAPAD